MATSQTDDLRAFESRLRECVQYYKKRSLKWKFILLAVCVWIAFALWNCFCDPVQYDSYLSMLWSHKSLTISCTVLFVLYLVGIGDKYNAGQVMVARSRHVLNEYNMSCDDSGRLSLKRARAADRYPPGAG